MPRALLILLAIVAASSAEAGPTLTIVAPAAPGGGWDQTARVMQRVLLEIDPGSGVQVENVPGAAGTIGLARFLQSERGNPNAVLVTGLVMVSGVVLNHSPVRLADATPLARLTGEFEVIVVPAASRYRSMTDLLTAFKSDPGAISWGGGSAGGTDDLLARLIAEQLGLEASRVNYVAFPGGGAALGAILAGQVTAGVSGYSEFGGQVAAGELRVLAVSAPERVAGIDAPTLREAGVDLDLANWRAIVAPPGISDGERLALIDRIAAMTRSKPWQSALTQYGWTDLYLPGQDFKQFLLAEQARVEAVLYRLTGTESARTPGVSLAMTPTTFPSIVVALFISTVGVLGARLVRRLRVDLSGFKATATVVAALLVQPLLLSYVGFVLSSTLLFAAVAHSLESASQAGPQRSMAQHLLLGFIFAAALFVVFSRGLGVMLPPTPGLQGWL